MKKRIGIYPGSFNPFTVGHYNILQKAKAMFDDVIVVVGQNPFKSETSTYTKNAEGEVYINSTQKRHVVLTEQLKIPVLTFTGYLTIFMEYIAAFHDAEVVLIRGLRNGDDLDYEVNQIRVLEDLLSPQMLKTCFIVCDRQFEHISSTVCRGMETMKRTVAGTIFTLKTLIKSGL